MRQIRSAKIGSAERVAKNSAQDPFAFTELAAKAQHSAWRADQSAVHEFGTLGGVLRLFTRRQEVQLQTAANAQSSSEFKR